MSQPEIAFVDNPHAPDVFADEAVGFLIHRGVVRVTLTSGHVSHNINPSPASRVVIGRLVMPAQSAAELAVGLFDFLQKHGVQVPGLRREGERVQ
ncbi:hypothetical protein [Plastoroseomonas hellenica]|jgi:hypothetical protein|uniref:Uncharacterized protein n=1 Tax=Plastoroseomonas hellenica TaxID=2687306 RepID=A0ABS5EZ30_9PROT|nr:hypothetical protein [Plastoroseomonas hellenica]MBR0642777.1 hypothetical protein [Plastoroseomonas hellenica]MBR0665568.1 hypothetical protein [Plastoroseomonas hellenica]